MNTERNPRPLPIYTHGSAKLVTQDELQHLRRIRKVERILDTVGLVCLILAAALIAMNAHEVATLVVGALVSLVQ